MYEHLASPVDIGSITLRNRIAMAAMGVEIAEQDGTAGEPIIAYYEARARGGAGLLITESCAMAYPRGAHAEGQLGLSSDDFLPGLQQLTSRVHEHGAKIAVQLTHHGKGSRVDAKNGRPVLMPSMPRFKGANDMAHDLSFEEMGLMAKAFGGDKPKIKACDEEDIAWVVNSFAAACERARHAGFDAVEIHAAHGYLLSEFLSPAWNFREDEYGGSDENRARLLCEVLAAAKDRAGADFPIWVRLDSHEFRTPGGITPELCVHHAELAEGAGADAIHVSAYADASSAIAFTEGPLPHDPGAYLDATRLVKSRVSVPVIAVGRIEADVADGLIRDGTADVIAMGRKLLADHEYAQKIVEGRPEDIRPCIYCYTCVAQPFFNLPVRCAVNPITGHEVDLAEADREKAATRRKVLVVGGGTSGLEAARLAATRGHDVVLCEKAKQLGGALRFASLMYEPNERLLDWLSGQVHKLGVEVRLETVVTADLVRDIAPDLVLVAAGASRTNPDVPGIDRDHVFDGDDLRELLTGDGDGSAAKKLSLTGRLAVRAGRATGVTGSLSQLRAASKAWMPLGKRVVVIGGGLVGVELAEFLLERGRKVTVLEEGPKLGVELAHPRRWRVLHELREHGAELVPGARVLGIDKDAVRYEVTTGEGETLPALIEADAVVIASGLCANDAIVTELEKAGVPVRAIGDVKGVGYIEGAMRDGFQAALEL